MKKAVSSVKKFAGILILLSCSMKSKKASPDVFNVLLQVLDDGHITDGQGRKVDFKNTVIIMTSNAGARSIVEPKRVGFTSMETEEQSYQNMKKNVMEEVRHIFKPEFLNRIDDMIVFHSLTQEGYSGNRKTYDQNRFQTYQRKYGHYRYLYG